MAGLLAGGKAVTMSYLIMTLAAGWLGVLNILGGFLK
jgi:hypothetical protein